MLLGRVTCAECFEQTVRQLWTLFLWTWTLRLVPLVPSGCSDSFAIRCVATSSCLHDEEDQNPLLRLGKPFLIFCSQHLISTYQSLMVGCITSMLANLASLKPVQNSSKTFKIANACDAYLGRFGWMVQVSAGHPTRSNCCFCSYSTRCRLVWHIYDTRVWQKWYVKFCEMNRNCEIMKW